MDIESLLKPISSENNCGEYLCYDHVYDELKELRREDDVRLSQGVWQTEPKRADWTQLNKLSCELLKTKTKDLQIAMWLMESWIIERQFEGFIDGLKLVKGLSEKFWDEIYPAIDWENHSYDYRLAPFFFLSDKISERIVLIPLTDAEDSLVYSLSDWMEARRNLQIKNSNGISLKIISKQVAVTTLETFKGIADQVEKSINLLKELKAFLDEKCGQDAPSFHQLTEYLEDIKRITLKNIELKEKQQAQAAQKVKVEKQASQPNTSDDEMTLEDDNKNQNQNREPTIGQAYDALSEIALFLENKQPQSPSSTLLKVAIMIGKKSFQELLELNMRSGVSVLNTISELYSIFYKKESEQKK
ncbi:MAG: type VI secretion system protein TssA [Alphaproteobacteria bacterium]|nr:type VI secretion system protein TssA [Alphaproteobacteria bacterium]